MLLLIDYIKKEIDAYKQEQNLISSNMSELTKEKNELATQLQNNGFIISADGQIANYSAQLTALTNQANAMASDTDAQNTARESAKKSVQDLSEATKRYTQIVGSELPQAQQQWDSLTNSIQDAYKSMQKLVMDAETKISDIIKDEWTRRVNTEKDALAKQKKAYEDSYKNDDYQDELKKAQDKVTAYDSQILQAMKARDKESIKELTQAKQDAVDELNKTIQDHERQSVSDSFDAQSTALDKKLTDLTNPQNMTALISDAMKSGVINVNGEVIKLSDAMNDFLKNSVTGTQNLNSQMRDLVNTLNDGVSAFDNAGLLNNITKSSLDTSLFQNNGNINLTSSTTSLADVTKSNLPKLTFQVNSPLVNIEKADSSNLDEISSTIDNKLSDFAKQLNDSLYSLG